MNKFLDAINTAEEFINITLEGELNSELIYIKPEHGRDFRIHEIYTHTHKMIIKMYND